MSEVCPVCNSQREVCFKSIIKRKYSVNYYYCRACGLLQTEAPYWLGEAYENAIAASDTGLIMRNFTLSRRLSIVLYFLLNQHGKYLDIAGGYGFLTRLMRDIGFNFYWSDLYCQNLLANGFELHTTSPPFTAVTAFEVLEHVSDPVGFIRDALKKSGSNIFIFSTELFEGEPPHPNTWWYYSAHTGQHITFYQRKTLKVLSEKLSLNLYSHKNFHMFSDKPVNRILFALLTGKLSPLAAYYVKWRMPSKTISDHDLLANR